jgi:hypothetical protein
MLTSDIGFAEITAMKFTLSINEVSITLFRSRAIENAWVGGIVG